MNYLNIISKNLMIRMRVYIFNNIKGEFNYKVTKEPKKESVNLTV